MSRARFFGGEGKNDAEHDRDQKTYPVAAVHSKGARAGRGEDIYLRVETRRLAICALDAIPISTNTIAHNT